MVRRGGLEEKGDTTLAELQSGLAERDINVEIGACDGSSIVTGSHAKKSGHAINLSWTKAGITSARAELGYGDFREKAGRTECGRRISFQRFD